MSFAGAARCTSSATARTRFGKRTSAILESRAIPGEQFNILFTCVGRRVALIEAFREAMRQLGLSGKIIATDVTTASPAFQRADLGLIVPLAGRIDYVPALLNYVKEHNVSLVVPLTDLDLRSLARQRDRFAEFGCTVMVGSEHTVTMCRDKAATSLMLAEAGLGTIRTLTLGEFYKNPFYPCFIKPIRGSAGVGSSLIRSERELKAHVATFGDLMIVQEYVPGQEYTLDVYRTRAGEVCCVVPRQRLVVRSGEVEKGVTVKDQALIDAALRLGGLLGDLWGVFCCQCRRDDGSPPRFFEINPRFGGGAPLSIAAGANLPLYLLQEVTGRPVTAKVGDFTDHLLMLRYDEAVYMHVNDVKSLPGFDAPIFR